MKKIILIFVWISLIVYLFLSLHGEYTISNGDDTSVGYSDPPYLAKTTLSTLNSLQGISADFLITMKDRGTAYADQRLSLKIYHGNGPMRGLFQDFNLLTDNKGYATAHVIFPWTFSGEAYEFRANPSELGFPRGTKIADGSITNYISPPLGWYVTKIGLLVLCMSIITALTLRKRKN